MNGLEAFFRAVEILAYIGIASIVSGLIALGLWVTHSYLSKVKAQREYDNKGLYMIFDECSEPLPLGRDATADNIHCSAQADGVHCDCWWDEKPCCSCGAE